MQSTNNAPCTTVVNAHAPLDELFSPTTTMTDLPPEIVEMISDHLPARDLGAFALTCKGYAKTVSYRLNREKISHELARMSGKADRRWGERLETFQRLMSDIQELRERHQSLPLQQLIACLDRLPQEECREAADALLRDFSSKVPESLRGRLELLAKHGSPKSAVAAGVSVNDVLHHFYSSCEKDVISRASIALRGIALQMGPAAEAISAGQAPEEIDERFGFHFGELLKQHFDDLGGERLCKLRAARRAAAGGRSVVEVAQEHGIASEDEINSLEYYASKGVAGEAAALGKPVQDVAQQYGISRSFPLRVLQHAACCGPASEAVRRGEPLDAVATRHGITDHQARFNLLLHGLPGSPGDAIRKGADVRDEARSLGVDLDDVAEYMMAGRSTTDENQVDRGEERRRVLAVLESTVESHAKSLTKPPIPFINHLDPLDWT